MTTQSSLQTTTQVVQSPPFLDAKNAKKFREQVEEIIDNGFQTVVIDCCELDYISSAGIRMLEKLAQFLETIHGSLILCSLEDYIEELFEMSGFNEVFSIEQNISNIFAAKG